MANWLSLESTAEKYGLPEKQLYEFVRLGYVTYSSIVDLIPDEEGKVLIDTDVLDDYLYRHAIDAYPEDSTITRVPVKQLRWLEERQDELQETINELMEELCESERLVENYKEYYFDEYNFSGTLFRLINQLYAELGPSARVKYQKTFESLCQLISERYNRS